MTTPSTYHETAIHGVLVVKTPADIDITTVDQLRAALLHATWPGHPVVVVDMTGTRFCDCSGFHTIAAAHRRALTDRRDLRIVISPRGAIPRLLALTGMHRVLPCFTSLQEALTVEPSPRHATGATW